MCPPPTVDDPFIFPTLKGSNGGARGEGRFDPYRVGILSGLQSVGGGHQNRALAHGYSLSTPAGFKDLYFRTSRVQAKIR